jgi:hypothetical protein
VSVDDWADLDEAYAPLRQRILAVLPAPFGWAPALVA